MATVKYRLSPSDFAYLWEECKHCYYQKVKFGISYSGIFPSMFGKINSLLQHSIMGTNLQSLHSDLPSGIIEVEEGFLRSQIIPGTNCFISGRFDILTKLDDGSHAIIDFKITTPEEDKIQKKYATQLHAYKYALENPDYQNTPIKISSLGVVSINPEEMKIVNGKVVFTTQPTWHPVKEDMDSFYRLISEISTVLNGELPLPSETCKLCIYRGRFSTPPIASTIEDSPF